MDHFGGDIEIVVDDRELASEVPGWLGRRARKERRNGWQE
jgi:hypothetical protein